MSLTNTIFFFFFWLHQVQFICIQDSEASSRYMLYRHFVVFFSHIGFHSCKIYVNLFHLLYIWPGIVFFSFFF